MSLHYTTIQVKAFCAIFCSGLLIFTGTANCQITNQFNLNIYNGLPSNHVYTLLIDRHGYLWMGTDKGVVRYNGYQTKIYNYYNGLVNEDVWRLQEDKKGRIWFFSISDQIGYVSNNVYRNVTNASHKTLYPRDEGSYDSSITFLTAYVADVWKSLCIEKNDTIRSYTPDRSLGDPVVAGDKIVYMTDSQITLTDYHLDDKNGIVVSKNLKQCKTPPDLRSFRHTGYSFVFKNYMMEEDGKAHLIKLDNLETCTQRLFYMDTCRKILKTPLNIGPTKKDIFYVRDSNFIFFDSDFQFYYIPMRSVISGQGIDPGKVSFCINDGDWGTCVSTSSDGVFINYKTVNEHFRFRADIDLHGCTSFGNIADSIFFWWNDASGTLAKMTATKTITYRSYNEMQNANKIVAYNADSSLLLSISKMYWMNNATGKLSNFFSRPFNYRDGTIDNGPGFGAQEVTIDRDNFFVLSKFIGFLKLKRTDSFLRVSYIDNDRYNGFTYDAAGGFFIVYNSNTVLIYNKTTERVFKIGGAVLNAFGIRSIETIEVDNKYGNIIVKEKDKIRIFNEYDLSSRTLFNNLRLKGTQLYLKNSMLVLVGKFGVAFSKIMGRSTISAPVVYKNIKDEIYSDVIDAQISGKFLYLNTDKGLYVIDIPSDSEFDHKKEDYLPKYKFIVSNNNRLLDIESNDTINIDQGNMHLQFDVINPTGNGTLKYAYSLNFADAEWHELNADELNLPKLKADNYYTLSVLVYDDVWRSNTIKIHLYISPYWWQKTGAVRLIWIGSILSAVLLVVVIIIATQKIATRKTRKRNLQLELELKSVHSQINPHFISNSLSVVMYLIKTGKLDEAYHHVSNFSHLLRSYIKSSRNRYTSLEEEIANLRTYIEMQQIRFNHKFEYSIVIDEGISGSTKIPSLLLQPLVENAIVHGLLEKDTKGHLNIEIKKISTDFVCIIEDDGIGRQRSRQLAEQSRIKKEAYGNDLVKDLVRIFNQYEKVDIHIDYKDKEMPQTGTIVMLTIKNYRNDDPLFLHNNRR